MEAFFVCVNGQMWTKRDKNRTQNRTQISGRGYAVISTEVARFTAQEPASELMSSKLLAFFYIVCFIVTLTFGPHSELDYNFGLTIVSLTLVEKAGLL